VISRYHPRRISGYHPNHSVVVWYRTVKNFGGEKTLANLANHNNSPTFFCQFFCFAICDARRNVSCALIVSRVRIEVRILILQYFKISSSLLSDSLYIHDKYGLQFTLPSSNNTLYEHVAQDKSRKLRSLFYYVHRCLQISLV